MSNEQKDGKQRRTDVVGVSFSRLGSFSNHFANFHVKGIMFATSIERLYRRTDG